MVAILAASPCLAESCLQGFVPIKGGGFKLGKGASQNGRMVRVEDFEILDHPVTNREYKSFVDETRYAAPLHWTGGNIPGGKEDYPVIFVNRKDIAAFLHWLSGKEGRICRLPTSVEFEYAARGGLTGRAYPWGDESPDGQGQLRCRCQPPFRSLARLPATGAIGREEWLRPVRHGWQRGPMDGRLS